jgi:hypothetical protein
MAVLRGVGGIEIFILQEVYLIKLYFYQQLTLKNGNILYLIQNYHKFRLFPIPTTSYIICGDVTEAELTNDHDRQSQTLAYIH